MLKEILILDLIPNNFYINEDIEGPTKLYLKIHEEAKYKGVTSIEKLKDKIVENKEHKKLWVDYCTKLMKNL